MAKKKTAPKPTFEAPKPPVVNTKSAVQIIHDYCDGRMSARPEFYSGRGVNTGDLNSKHLMMIYKGITTELGATAAEAFVEMLQVLKDMSATGFLNSLYRLEANKWVFDKTLFNHKNDGIAYKGVGEDGGASALFTVMEVMGRPRDSVMDEFMASTITRPFFAEIGVEPKQKPKRSGWPTPY